MTAKITWTNEKRKLSELKPWTRNPRQIDKVSAERLADSFASFGQVETIAIGPDNELYNGHQRLNVLQDKHGKDFEVEVRVSSRALTEKEREKLTVYLHKGATGEFDFDALANEFELDDLLEWGFEPFEFGLDDDFALAETAGQDAEPQVDRAEELRVKWGVESGQMWRLGEHRIICGDCTDKAVVDRLMGGEKPDLTLTDPPYNVGKDYGSSTDDKRADYMRWNEKWFSLCNSSCVVFTPGTVNLSDWIIFKKPKWICVWRKINQQSPSGLQGYNIWEPLLVYGKQPKPVGHDSWDIPVSQSEDLAHPVPKTLEAWSAFLEAFSNKDSVVYDPFLGSGTTLIACENLKRKCRAVEISPAYVAVAIQRWVDLTGGTPELIEG